jgi:hypothetical protein
VVQTNKCNNKKDLQDFQLLHSIWEIICTWLFFKALKERWKYQLNTGQINSLNQAYQALIKAA